MSLLKSFHWRLKPAVFLNMHWIVRRSGVSVLWLYDCLQHKRSSEHDATGWPLKLRVHSIDCGYVNTNACNMRATNPSAFCQYVWLHGSLRHQNAMKSETIIYHLTLSCWWQANGCWRPDTDGVDRGNTVAYSNATSPLCDIISEAGLCVRSLPTPGEFRKETRTVSGVTSFLYMLNRSSRSISCVAEISTEASMLTS